MKTSYQARLAFSNLARSKLRTWLTITGIVIGVAAVVLIVSLGSGLQRNVSSQLGGLGADLVTVTPGFSRAQGFGGFERGGGGGGSALQTNLTTKDVQALKLVPNIKYIMGSITDRASMVFANQNFTASVKGVDPALFPQFSTDSIAGGRMLVAGDANAVVVGDRIANQYFKRPVTVNSLITLNGKTFRVVGVLAPGSGFGSDDSAILMPIASARTLFSSFASNQFSSISVKVADISQLDATTAAMDYRLSLSRHVTNQTKDFTITAVASIQNQIQSVTSSISTFLGGIAAISLLVGAIGIANTMFMAVLERTRQIGVLKALGATSGEVSRMFLIESGVLGISGGVIAILLCLLASFALDSLGIGLSLPGVGRGGGRSSLLIIDPLLALGALAFSAFLGMVAGYIPAKQAASLKPVDALRYE